MTNDDPGTLFDIAKKLEREGNTEEAIKAYRHVATNWPSSIEGAAASREYQRITGNKPSSRIGNRQKSIRISFRSDFATGLAISRFIAFMGWVVVTLGILATFLLINDSRQVNWIVIGGTATISCFGLMLVALGQSSRALFEMANTNREILAIIKTITRAEVTSS